ncbi:peptide deformylase [Pseudemcibacter aquimaris]|uniref:peptide deformylase n=1 Tax=Pseudemcibacter aquimaris TaxID=2857064 RepID=UPI002012125A|nr:peptide deformylase [Pseudemcibacter aquimaris]MCC3861457.1 peptide deformylase [Pseudemcibacter aquimaris]WDU58226.1 peptide deformylase [Pseudemcibacter aquimaris]
MKKSKLIYGPDPIFKKTSSKVECFDEENKALCQELTHLLYQENAVGVAAPMIGALKRIIAYDLQENGNNPVVMINPEITKNSETTQSFSEGSICFPGVSADISRPDAITVRYQDIDGSEHSLDAEGWLATVIQHEMDYLDGKTIFDYLSPMKRKMLFKKTKKHQKENNL